MNTGRSDALNAQKKTGATALALVRMMFCEVELGFGFCTVCAQETGAANAMVDMVLVRGEEDEVAFRRVRWCRVWTSGLRWSRIRMSGSE